MTYHRSLPAPLVVLALGLVACPSPTLDDDTDTESTGSDSTTTMMLPPGTTTTTSPGTGTSDTGSTGPQVDSSTGGSDSSTGGSDSSTGDTGSTGSTGTTGEPGCMGDECSNLLDLIFVIDNSGTMGEEQQNLAGSLPLFVEQLQNLTAPDGTPLGLDVHVMVTTSDMGNPLCTPFEPPGYDPAQGSPTDTPCTDRLQDFTNLIGTESIPEACLDTCPVGVAPADPFVAFAPGGSNVAGMPVDIDGDGVPDSPEAQALACIGPQGINGCGYEAQLESMLQALNPNASWNSGGNPFLRDGSTVGLVMVTDEADCSVDDFTIMEDPALQNINPDNGMPSASSAICWNAGVTCQGPDAMGVYSSCSASAGNGLHPLSRYTNYLVSELRGSQGREVFMLGIVGVPPVTQRSPNVPFEPQAGGVLDLVYRNWLDGQFPVGDILPDEFAMGETAADKQFDFGIGPGCTGVDGLGQFTGQAIPPVRMLEVCEALNLDATPEGTRCCVESICDEDYSGALTCLSGMVSLTTAPAP